MADLDRIIIPNFDAEAFARYEAYLRQSLANLTRIPELTETATTSVQLLANGTFSVQIISPPTWCDAYHNGPLSTPSETRETSRNVRRPQIVI
jgi:hypothetical protein